MGTVWMIASGKGGVGKSTVTAALAMALARQEMKVCIIDADIGLRDQDAILGLENRIVYDLVDVANKNCRLPQALISPAEQSNLSLLPAAQFARAKELEPKSFRRILRQLKETYDHVLIDCPAGVERSLRGLMNEAIDETVILCTPDDVCIRNAERVVSIMDQKKLPRPRLIVNRLSPALIRCGEMYSAQVVAGVLDLPLLGEITDDPLMYRALLKHISPMDVDCEARPALIRIAARMTGQLVPLPEYGIAKLPWYRRLRRPKVKEVKRIDC